MNKKEKGLSLVELLAVIVIIAIITLIAISLITVVVSNSRKTVYLRNAKSMERASAVFY